MTVGCIPWNYPRASFEATEPASLCTGQFTLDFESHFYASHLNTSICQCPLECHRLEFKYSKDSSFLDPVVECQDWKMVEMANSRIQSGTDRFGWVYSRQAHKKVFSIPEVACHNSGLTSGFSNRRGAPSQRMP